MGLDHHILKRLAFVRYLYETAVSQSYAPAPLKCASVLTMHDAVELFLQLSCEQLNVGAKQPPFMEYWDLLNPQLNPNELAQKESMRRLNRARVALKHHGTFPSDLDIEAFRASATSFFQDNTPLVFGVVFEDVSLVEYVNPEASRLLLTEAQADIATGDIHSALGKIAIAYEEMIRDYEDRKRDRHRRSPFYFGRDLAFHGTVFMGLGHGTSSNERRFAEFVDRVKESIETMQGAIKTIALGIDYRKYSKFKRLTPALVRTMDGQWHVQRFASEADNLLSAEGARFCIAFVVESALALAEFDYSTLDDA